jgi:uncharacterized protein YjiS (DUF1127 family)
MSKIRHCIATWRKRAALRRELKSLSDRILQDIGVARCYPSAGACKPFWMA